MKKMQSVAGILLALTLVLALTACEQSTSSDPVDYGEAPPAEYVGTWTTEASSGSEATSEMTLRIESSGNVSVTAKLDMTLMVQFMLDLVQSTHPSITEAQLWASIQDSSNPKYNDPAADFSPNATVTYSSSSPWIITIIDVQKYEDIKTKPGTTITLSADGKTLTITDIDEETSEEETTVFTKQ